MVYHIGNLKLQNRVLLAPMLEPNDIAFRILCKRAGCGLTYTGMTSPLSRKELHLDDNPALQLFGNSPEGIFDFIKKYDGEVSLWDFNLGCPSKLSKKHQHGAFMMKEAEEIKSILKTIRESTSKPVTIKIRKGDNALRIAHIAEQAGVDAVAIHARTVSQGYSGEVDYGFALQIKKAVKIPVIFSGDVKKENIAKILEDFDFVMVGRSAIGNPSFFKMFSNSNANVSFKEYLKLAEKYSLPFRQIKYQAMNFTKGNPRSKRVREKIIKVKSTEELKEILGKHK